jgi:hypothetical protein
MTTGSVDHAMGLPAHPTRLRLVRLGWFARLPMQRKILLFLTGGLLTLVFDAFVAHFSWQSHTMRWKQTIPIIYGLLSAGAVGTSAVFALRRRVHARLVAIVGGIGMAVGVTGVALHALTLIENLQGESLAIMTIGKALSLSAPLFAPAAFAGVGFLMLALPRIAPMPR